MLKYYLRRAGVTVSIVSNSPNESAVIEYSGDYDVLLDAVKAQLPWQYGAFGHLIGSSCTPIDLDAAMRALAMQEFEPEVIEGANLVQIYNPYTPPGALT